MYVDTAAAGMHIHTQTVQYTFYVYVFDSSLQPTVVCAVCNIRAETTHGW